MKGRDGVAERRPRCVAARGRATYTRPTVDRSRRRAAATAAPHRPTPMRRSMPPRVRAALARCRVGRRAPRGVPDPPRHGARRRRPRRQPRHRLPGGGRAARRAAGRHAARGAAAGRRAPTRGGGRRRVGAAVRHGLPRGRRSGRRRRDARRRGRSRRCSRAAADGLARRGRCAVGDKTILDTLAPAADAFEAAAPRAAVARDALRARPCAPARRACARRAPSSRGAAWRCGSASGRPATSTRAPCRACCCCARSAAAEPARSERAADAIGRRGRDEADRLRARIAQLEGERRRAFEDAQREADALFAQYQLSQLVASGGTVGELGAGRAARARPPGRRRRRRALAAAAPDVPGST